jgi:hypothetical protein
MCNNTIGSYSCSCITGWQGSICDVDVNECLTFPCNTSYTCINNLGSFSCKPIQSGMHILLTFF